jgi:hypothetical protein
MQHWPCARESGGQLSSHSAVAVHDLAMQCLCRVKACGTFSNKGVEEPVKIQGRLVTGRAAGATVISTSLPPKLVPCI